MSENKISIIKNLFWKFAERILAQGVSLLVSIVLARLLLPEDYGAISMVTVFITIANVFVTSGIPSALVQKKDATKEDFSTVFYFNFIVSILIYLILFVAAPYIADFYDYPVLSPVLRFMGLRIIVASINSVQHSYVSRHMMFKKYFWSTFFGTLFSGVIGVGMAYTGFGVWALAAQYMINTCVDTIVLFFTVKWRPNLFFSWKITKELFKFGWKILFQGLSSTFTVQMKTLIVGKVYSSSDLGYYTKGQQFPQLVVTNINSSISSVMFPAMSNIQEDLYKVKELLRKSIRLSSYIIFPLLTGLGMVATPFVSLVLTDKWLPCVPYLQLFCVNQALTVGMVLRHQALTGIGRSDVFMHEHNIGFAVSILLLVLFFRRSVMAIAICDVVSQIAMFFIVMYTSKRFNLYSYKEQIMDLLPILLGCVIMSIPVYFIGLLPLLNFVMIFLQVLAGGITYLLYSIIFKVEEFETVFGLLKRAVNIMAKKGS